jgi:hypothetical protein
MHAIMTHRGKEMMLEARLQSACQHQRPQIACEKRQNLELEKLLIAMTLSRNQRQVLKTWDHSFTTFFLISAKC